MQKVISDTPYAPQWWSLPSKTWWLAVSKAFFKSKIMTQV